MTAVALVALLFLVLLNGLFVAAEFALVRSSRGRLEALAKDGKAGVDEVLEQLEKLDEVLAACQLGITMASIGIGFLGEPAIASLLEPRPRRLGRRPCRRARDLVRDRDRPSHHDRRAGAEDDGHNSGRSRAARLLARPVNWFRVATKPLTWALNRASNGIVRLFGVDPSGLEEKHTSEDVKGIIRHSARGGTLDPGEAIMLGGVFHLHEQEAREVMTPIPAVVTVNANETVEDALQRCVSSGHTRLVAIENDNPDRVRGIVHNNSLARLYMNTGADASIESAIREVPIVPETKPLDDLLAELQRQRSSIGVVVDEYGRTVGIVTVEDILEEVVGEIEDETDARSSMVRRLADGDWYVRGHVAIGDLVDAGIELPVDSDAYNSVGGYVFSELGRLPKRGDRIQANGHEIRVESVRENRIVAVRIRPMTAEHPVVIPPETEEE